MGFRKVLIEHDLDARLVDRTVEVAEQKGGFGSRKLRAALDSSPLWGAGRVEDTYNLLGHALRKALGVIARQQGSGLAEVAIEAGAELVADTSLKAALDLNWDEPEERQGALVKVLAALEAVEMYLDGAHTAYCLTRGSDPEQSFASRKILPYCGGLDALNTTCGCTSHNSWVSTGGLCTSVLALNCGGSI